MLVSRVISTEWFHVFGSLVFFDCFERKVWVLVWSALSSSSASPDTEILTQSLYLQMYSESLKIPLKILFFFHFIGGKMNVENVTRLFEFTCRNLSQIYLRIVKTRGWYQIAYWKKCPNPHWGFLTKCILWLSSAQ